jgi:hypothetical protein
MTAPKAYRVQSCSCSDIHTDIHSPPPGYLRAKHFVAQADDPPLIDSIQTPKVYNPFARTSTNVGMSLTYRAAQH